MKTHTIIQVYIILQCISFHIIVKFISRHACVLVIVHARSIPLDIIFYYFATGIN